MWRERCPRRLFAKHAGADCFSADHFTVDGTLLDGRASHKSCRARDEGTPQGGGRNRPCAFKGERRRRETHVSTTDPEARLCYLDHLLTENRHGLVVAVELTEADVHAGRDAALAMIERSVSGQTTLGADRAYDTRDFVWDLRGLSVTPQVAQNERGRRSAIDGRTTLHPGYRRSQRRRKLVEEVFGWIKTVDVGGKLRYLGRARNKLWFELAAAYQLTRLANIEAAAAKPNRTESTSGNEAVLVDPTPRPSGPTLRPESARRQLSSDCCSGLNYAWFSSLLGRRREHD